MISRYVVYEAPGRQDLDDVTLREPLGEFEQLETAMDFVEFYRRKYPAKFFQVRGLSYVRSGMNIGGVVSSWEPIEPELQREAVAELLTWLLPDPE